MFRGGWIAFRVIGTLLLIGFLVVGGGMLYRSGQAQGYAMGLAAAGQDGAAPLPNNAPVPYYGTGPYYGFGWGHNAFLFPFSPLIGFFAVGGLFFLFFGVIGAIFRRRAWAHGPGGHGPWTGGPRHGYPWGPPPWTGQPQPAAPGEPAPPAGQAPGEPSK